MGSQNNTAAIVQIKSSELCKLTMAATSPMDRGRLPELSQTSTYRQSDFSYSISLKNTLYAYIRLLQNLFCMRCDIRQTFSTSTDIRRRLSWACSCSYTGLPLQ